MPLIKHRPRVRLLVPREIAAGSVVRAAVEVVARRDLDIEHVEATLVGTLLATVGSGKSARYHREPLLQLAARLSEERRLTVGSLTLPFGFRLPAGLPPTHAGNRIRVQYSVTVRVGIDWWPDRRAEFEVFVVPTPAASPPPSPPVVYSTRPAGPRADEPYLELSLTAATAVPGGKLSGAIALGNTQQSGFERLRVALVSLERSHVGGASDSAFGARYAAELGKAPADGVSLPISLPIPLDATPSFDTPHGVHEWMVEVTAVRRWRSDLTLLAPVRVLPAGTPLATARAAPPAVGSDRISAVWSAVAAQAGLAHDPDAQLLRGVVDDVELTIRREHRGRHGLVVVAELRYRALGLALEIEPAGLLRVVSPGIALGDGWWDERHVVRGREAAQVAGFGRALLPAIRALGTVRMDDTRAVVDWRDAGHAREPLAAFARSMVALARAIPQARAAIPPPAAMGSFVPAWRAAAARLGGALDVACMTIRAEVAGARAQIRTEWSEEAQPAVTVLELLPPLELDARTAALLEQPAGPAAAKGGPATWSPEARGIGRRLLEGAQSLEVGAGVLTLRLDAPVADPAPLVTRLDALARLAATLAATGGPYR